MSMDVEYENGVRMGGGLLANQSFDAGPARIASCSRDAAAQTRTLVTSVASIGLHLRAASSLRHNNTVDTQNSDGCVGSESERTDFALETVQNTFLCLVLDTTRSLDLDTCMLFSCSMSSVQFGDNVGGLLPRVVSKGAGHNLHGFGVGLDGVLV